MSHRPPQPHVPLTHRWKLEQAEEAYELFEEMGAVAPAASKTVTVAAHRRQADIAVSVVWQRAYRPLAMVL